MAILHFKMRKRNKNKKEFHNCKTTRIPIATAGSFDDIMKLNVSSTCCNKICMVTFVLTLSTFFKHLKFTHCERVVIEFLLDSNVAHITKMIYSNIVTVRPYVWSGTCYWKCVVPWKRRMCTQKHEYVFALAGSNIIWKNVIPFNES